MDEKAKFECGICFYQGKAKDFTPITVSCSFAALECPQCLNNATGTFEEIKKNEQEKADALKAKGAKSGGALQWTDEDVARHLQAIGAQ